jgi:hypothetical protein
MGQVARWRARPTDPRSRETLKAIISDRNAPQKHVWRAHIILATADGLGTGEIMRRSGKSKPVVWTWQAQFMGEGGTGFRRAHVIWQILRGLWTWIAGPVHRVPRPELQRG